MKIHNLLLPVFTLLITLGCSKESMDKPTQLEGSSLSIGEKELLCTGSQFTCAFTSVEPWEIKGLTDWITISKEKGGAGTTSITISAGLNENKAERTTRLAFVSQKDGSLIDSLVVKQNYPYIHLDQNALSFEWNNCKKTETKSKHEPAELKVMSNINWIIEPYQPKQENEVVNQDFDFSSTGGKGDQQLKIIPNVKNYSKLTIEKKFKMVPVIIGEKGEIIRIEDISKDAVDCPIFTLSQHNLRFLINNETEDIIISLDELNHPIDPLNIDCEINWTFSSNQSWIRCTRGDVKEDGTYNLTIEADGVNPTKESRKGEITLTAKSDTGEAERTLHIEQAPFSLDYDIEKLDINNNDVKSHSLQLTASGPWCITNIPDWLEVSPSNSHQIIEQPEDKKYTITVKAKERNYKFTDNQVLLNVRSELNQLNETIEISQEQFIFDIQSEDKLDQLLTADTQEHKIIIKISDAYEILSYPDWVQLSNTEESNIIKVSCKDANPFASSRDRVGKIVIRSTAHLKHGEDVRKEIEIRQLKHIIELTKNGSKSTIDAYSDNSSELEYNLKCSTEEWEIESMPSWLHYEKSIPIDNLNQKLTFKADNNTSSDARSGEIKIRCKFDRFITQAFGINQDAFVFDQNTLEKDIASYSKKPEEIKIKLTAYAPLTVENLPDWITLASSEAIKSDASGHATIRFHLKGNPEKTERTGKFNIVCPVNNQKKEIIFHQEKNTFDETKIELNFTELPEKQEVIKLISSGPWELKKKPDWVEISPENGEPDNEKNENTINISVTKNNGKKRNGEVILISSLNDQMKKIISVNQEEFHFDNKEQKTTVDHKENTITVDIICSGEWQVEKLPDWISAAYKSNKGNGDGVPDKLELKTKVNDLKKDRTAEIKIFSKDFPEMIKKITIIQTK